jgi:hypothetical protein
MREIPDADPMFMEKIERPDYRNQQLIARLVRERYLPAFEQILWYQQVLKLRLHRLRAARKVDGAEEFFGYPNHQEAGYVVPVPNQYMRPTANTVQIILGVRTQTIIEIRKSR